MEIISPKTDFLAKELFMKKYHSVYYLRDEEGKLFTDLFEVHIIELRKQLKGNDAVNDWIRFFNAKSGEELDMIHTKNVGINAAIGEVKKMSLSEHMRARYEAHMKEIRDRNAKEDYVRKLGREEGREEGIRVLVETCKELGIQEAEIVTKLKTKFGISEKDAHNYIEKY